MVNWELLDKKIEESGLKRGYIYENLEITRYGWSKKRTRGTDFSVKQIHTLCKLLNIKSLREKDEIFFADM